MTRRAVFLDRDGVLNRAVVKNGRPYPPDGLDDLEILAGVEDACRDLRAAGFMLIIVTNQPDVARGRQSQLAIEQINDRLRQLLGVDAVSVCYHDDADDCDCRKPKPGLLWRSAAELNIDLAASFMVGDRWKDVEAGRRAGCQTILVASAYAERQPEAMDCTVSSLREAADWILSRSL